jgi:hypothetical protein
MASRAFACVGAGLTTVAVDATDGTAALQVYAAALSNVMVSPLRDLTGQKLLACGRIQRYERCRSRALRGEANRFLEMSRRMRDASDRQRKFRVTGRIAPMFSSAQTKSG